MSLRQRFNQSVIDSWYNPNGGWTLWLKPLSAIFSMLAEYRKHRYLDSVRWTPPVPVIVVGNITVGGTGKTPVVSALIHLLKEQGYRPGIISRGYGTEHQEDSVVVTVDSDPAIVGDEPVMLAKLQVPLVVDADRVRGAKHLCTHFDCNVIVADDGLQHYNLQRHIELAVLDGQRLLGNGFCLPVGPLREPQSRLNAVDFVLVNCPEAVSCEVYEQRLERSDLSCFSLVPFRLRRVSDDHEGAAFSGRVHAVAGIGNPDRFFSTLKSLGYDVIPHPFADHHGFAEEDVNFEDDLPVIMTEKDAVKCRSFAGDHHWYLPVTTELPDKLIDSLLQMIEARKPVAPDN
ncbi:tetraacyldisaccharide 4'-kinase [Endozoicomonas ascidiicola]|uniref:tetraacyldisaccharide 4'-kinase n=1 Tax=Endozoicomonas ascidiicola TaxID=1698521 RepID=UPI000830D435|nr:tetraacyldisaccharide 4'-kinase [Endozoicomonas ascidiicola]